MLKDFENQMSELENIVKSLEEGSLTLSDSLKLFEKGIGLSNKCQKTLATAEQKVEILTEKGLEDFNPSDESSAQ